MFKQGDIIYSKKAPNYKFLVIGGEGYTPNEQFFSAVCLNGADKKGLLIPSLRTEDFELASQKEPWLDQSYVPKN